MTNLSASARSISSSSEPARL